MFTKAEKIAVLTELFWGLCMLVGLGVILAGSACLDIWLLNKGFDLSLKFNALNILGLIAMEVALIKVVLWFNRRNG